MSKVYINGRSVVHKGDGQTNVCGTPDVCKTPSPGGPIPVPYVNVAQDGDLASGSRSVSIEGNPIALEDSYLSTKPGKV
ncbi:MAG: PAAR-like domain-containing protein, partial [Hyalangium sp.]|uniref:PAAR-like domain-containing protein n=1 Tax=Hyalangium sp. TaxID=2028555 RepID=UPI00389A0ABA